MKRFFLSIILVFVLVSSSWAIAFADTVLWSQTPEGSSFCASSHTWPADDFQFDVATYVTRVDWWGGRHVGEQPLPDGFYIRFYENVYDQDLGHNRAGDSPIYEQFFSGDAHQATDEYSHAYYYSYYVDLSDHFIASASQTYWISIQGDLTNDPNGGWWGWRKAGTQNLNPAEFNGHGYSHHPINEDPFSSYDLAFELQGAPVPIPSAVWLLGSGLAGLVSLRRKKRNGVKSTFDPCC